MPREYKLRCLNPECYLNTNGEDGIFYAEVKGETEGGIEPYNQQTVYFPDEEPCPECGYENAEVLGES